MGGKDDLYDYKIIIEAGNYKINAGLMKINRASPPIIHSPVQ